MNRQIAFALVIVAGCTSGPDGSPGDSGDDGTDDGTADDGGGDGGDDDDGSPTPDAAPVEPIVGEPAELAGMTAAHNTLRATHGVGPMVWNEDLEALAAGFISDCVFAHSTQGERSNVAGFGYVGENLYSSGGGGAPTAADVSALWASEEADYDYATNGCTGMCGHYTQQVWAASVELGCAMQACPGNSYMVACEYGPGGNYIGERPY